MDDNTIDNARSFDPLRWANQQGASASFAHSSASNLHFGLGRYACPGRFFASVCIARVPSVQVVQLFWSGHSRHDYDYDRFINKVPIGNST